MPGNPLVLLVEDDESLSAWVAEYLSQHQFEVVIEHRGDLALSRIQELQPALVILDVMLPGKSGFDVCRELKPANPVPVLMLTARDDDIDQVVGLELGADDYVVKPVQPRILLARVQALLRRIRSPESSNNSGQKVFGKLVIDKVFRQVSFAEIAISLSDGEFDLLWELVSHPGEPLNREQLLQSMRGIEYDGLDRSIDARISQLRRKLNTASGHGDNIKTVRGKGYLFVPDGWL